MIGVGGRGVTAGRPAERVRNVRQVVKNGGRWPAVSAGSFVLENVTFREPSSQNRHQAESGSRAPEGSRNVTFPNRNEPADTAGHPASVFDHLSNVSGHLRSPRRPGRGILKCINLLNFMKKCEFHLFS